MLKKTITYIDFNGEETHEDHFFHLSKAELIELEMSVDGGLSASLQRIVDAQDGKRIIEEFKNIILGAYGKRSEDGKRFIKSQAIREEFESTEAYSTLFMELVTNAAAAAAFITGVIPQDMADEAAKLVSQIPPEAPALSSKALEVRQVTQSELDNMNTEDLKALTSQIAAGEAVLIQ